MFKNNKTPENRSTGQKVKTRKYVQATAFQTGGPPIWLGVSQGSKEKGT